VEQGFDFLGQNVRRYPNGKLLIKPSKKKVRTFLEGIRRTIKDAHGMSAADLIDQLNPKIRGWATYHRHVVSKRTFGRVDLIIFSSLWRWARRRHPNKTSRWFKPKYFDRRGTPNWSFFGETCDDEGRPNKVWLYHAKSTPINAAAAGSPPVRAASLIRLFHSASAIMHATRPDFCSKIGASGAVGWPTPI
jgi:RNA-directed DNA polymerase